MGVGTRVGGFVFPMCKLWFEYRKRNGEADENLYISKEDSVCGLVLRTNSPASRARTASSAFVSSHHLPLSHRWYGAVWR